jgi:PIN domain nuclease of toxin-antitoxin system
LTEERAAWLDRVRRENAEQEDALSQVFDERWGEIEETHRAYVDRFLAAQAQRRPGRHTALGAGQQIAHESEKPDGRRLLVA